MNRSEPNDSQSILSRLLFTLVTSQQTCAYRLALATVQCYVILPWARSTV
jgi:hypothetical protein